MKYFKDDTGREWSMALNVTSIGRVRDKIQVDLLSIVEEKGKLLQQLADDPVLLCNVLYVLVEPQCKEREITDEQFGELLFGDTIDRATSAFLEELVSFFPRGKRDLIAKALAKVKLYHSVGLEKLSARLDSDELDAAVRARIDAAVAELKV